MKDMLANEMIPQDPAAPSSLEFPISNLYRLPRIPNRAQYEALFGKQAPPYNPTRRRKFWFDGSVDLPKSYTYTGFQDGGLVELTISDQEAASVNLPGEYRYPPYVVADTPATVISPGEGTFQQPLPPDSLSSKADADALGEDLGLPVIDQSSVIGSVVWNGEARRLFGFVLGDGLTVLVARLLRDRAQRGVGAPGGWFWGQQGSGPGKMIWLPWGPDAIAAHATPDWSPTNQDIGYGDSRPEIPIPCRHLLDGESIIQRSFAGATTYLVVKPGSSVGTGDGGGGGLTSEQAAILADTNRLAKAIGKVFGVS